MRLRSYDIPRRPKSAGCRAKLRRRRAMARMAHTGRCVAMYDFKVDVCIVQQLLRNYEFWATKNVNGNAIDSSTRWRPLFLGARILANAYLCFASCRIVRRKEVQLGVPRHLCQVLGRIKTPPRYFPAARIAEEVMVWSAFSAKGKTPVVFAPGTMNSQR